MQNLFAVKLSVQEMLGIISYFSLFSSAVTFKIRSRSQNANQVVSMSKSCTHAKVLYGQVIRSGYSGFNIIFGRNKPVFYCSDLEN